VEALYRFDGTHYHPGALTVGPWSPDAQHGGPVSALLAGALEEPAGDGRSDADAPMQTVRATVELMRPVPLAPLEVAAEVVRPGRNVQWVEATMSAAGSVVARARGLRIRRAPLDVPMDRTPPPAPPPDDSEPVERAVNPRTAFAAAVDMRFVHSSWDELGPTTLWARLLSPVVEGREASPLQRAVAVADFANGISRVVDFTTHTFVNPDITVALARAPRGEWLLYEMVSRLSPEGFGQAESQIYDGDGPVGRAVQSLIVNRRP
jgi:hypothetical protein